MNGSITRFNSSMNLTTRIVLLLKKHKGGEKFFGALDEMVRNDIDILEDFRNTIPPEHDQGLILSGQFGQVFYQTYKNQLPFRELILVNGGIRTGKMVVLGVSELTCESYVFADDSFYSGKTRDGIEQALKDINPQAKITGTYVIYDGSRIKHDSVYSMFRYY